MWLNEWRETAAYWINSTEHHLFTMRRGGESVHNRLWWGKDGFTRFVDKNYISKKIGRRVGCKLANNTVLSTARFVQTASILHDFKVYICKTQLRHQVHIIQSLHFCFIYSTFLVKIQQNWHTCKHFLPRQDPLSFLDWPKISQIDQNQ